MTDDGAKGDTGDKLRVGVSTCLLGRKVRYDGEHKRDAFLVDQLGPFVEWVPVCPELEVGMGVPREAVHLVSDGQRLRMVGSRSGEDWTERMNALSARRVKDLPSLVGYVLKSRSPSCGMERVKVHEPSARQGMPRRDGVGLFAQALRARFPSLPVEEEGRLQDARLRENFIERIFAYHRLQSLLSGRFSAGALVAFHTAHKMSLLAHSEPGYRALGRLVAAAGKGSGAAERSELRRQYEALFMEVLSRPATRARHTNVLQHMVGHLREKLDARDRAELAALIDDYRRGLVPLIVPVTLLRHHVERQDIAYLRGQIYLEPHPKELMLRNHV